LKEERRIRVFENRVLRRIFGPKRDEVIGKWRNIRLIKFYSGNQIEKNEMGGVCGMYDRRGA
jgi:hypothetical protein